MVKTEDLESNKKNVDKGISVTLSADQDHPAVLSISIKGCTKNFPDNEKLKEFIITKPVLHEMLKSIL